MRKFAVTYRYDNRSAICSVMEGNELARLYGFSDCTDVEVLKIWEVARDGDLVPCWFWGDRNVLFVHRFGNYEPYEYEWDEH